MGFKPPEEDIARLRKLAAALPDSELIVDLNQSWTPAIAKRWLPALEELPVVLIEQPLPADDIENLARLTNNCAIPVMIDEGAFSAGEVARAGKVQAGNVLSLKLVKSGGLMDMKRAAAIAAASGMELYGGCLLESGIGAAAHLAVFSTLPKLHWGTEHFGPRILTNDLIKNGIVFEEFKIRCPTGPGLGVSINEDYVKDIARTDWTAL